MTDPCVELGGAGQGSAITNENIKLIVLLQKFTFLPLGDLKNCRLLNKNWSFQICVFMRDFRRCNVNIHGSHSCLDLSSLNELIFHMKTVPINSISINLRRCNVNVTACQCERVGLQTYGHLLEKLSLKYLSIAADAFIPAPSTCMAFQFLMNLLHENRSRGLHILEISRGCPPGFDHYFNNAWLPFFGKLESLERNLWTNGRSRRNFFSRSSTALQI